MLRPDKHTDPTLSVVNIAGLIIEEIKNNDILGYDDLLNSLINQISESVKDVFLYSLSFLYLLGKVEYLPDSDALRLKI